MLGHRGNETENVKNLECKRTDAVRKMNEDFLVNYSEVRCLDCATSARVLLFFYLLNPTTGWQRETAKFEIIRKNEGNLQNFI